MDQYRNYKSKEYMDKQKSHHTSQVVAGVWKECVFPVDRSHPQWDHFHWFLIMTGLSDVKSIILRIA
jgi:hypothetical protein